MKISQIIQETTTAGSVAPTEMGFVKMQTRNPSVYGGNKVGNLLKGKKTSKPFANSLNEAAMKDLAYDLQSMKPAEFQKKYGKSREEMKAAMSKQPKPTPPVNEADLSEQDLIVIPGQGRKSKSGFVPHGQSRVDHEVEMARSDLISSSKNAESIYKMIESTSEDEGLEGWVQEKIIKANDYLNTVREYLEGKEVQSMAEGYNPAEQTFQHWVDITRNETRQFGETDGANALEIMAKYSGDDKLETIRNILAYVRQNRAVLGKEVSEQTGKTVKDCIIDIRKAYPQLYQAAQQPQGVAEGSRKAWLKHNDLVDIEKPLAGLKSEFEKFLQTHDPEEKRKYQQGIKQRIKSEPMSGPTGALPEGAKVDRMVKHIEKSERKLGKSKDEAENIAWATANKRGMLDNKNKKAK